MDEAIYCQIRVKGHLSGQWDNWFGGLTIENQPTGEAVLVGFVPDQSALHGILSRIHDFGLKLIALSCSETLRDYKRISFRANAPETGAKSENSGSCKFTDP